MNQKFVFAHDNRRKMCIRDRNMSIKLYSTKKGVTMMNFIEIAKKRYSVRNYSGKKVEKEKLDKILQAAHVAPTAANLQPRCV